MAIAAVAVAFAMAMEQSKRRVLNAPTVSF